MAFKVNYNQQRNERDRAKQAKKDAKLREREEEVMRRRNAQQGGDAPQDDAPPQDGGVAADGAPAPRAGDGSNGTA
ncbi:MAG: hypothetical protein IT555_16170 [Acetobacteraceae bacterium]|nr:hypothetical protein [Acetobacteraceae bacterium]